MPKFLTINEVYQCLERENPEDVYAQSADPSKFYPTSDHYAWATTIGNAYANQDRVYENYFPQTTDESISDWELFVFGKVSDGNLSLDERRQAVIDKIRATGGITKSDIEAAVALVFPFLAPSGFEVVRWNSPEGSWFMDESQLDISTVLDGENLVDAVGPTLCHDAPSKYGKTDAEWAIAQEEAYTYEVRIYNYTLTPSDSAMLDAYLSQVEPGVATHVFVDGLTDADRIDGDT